MATSGEYRLTFRYLQPNEVIVLGSVLPGVCAIVTGFRIYTRRREQIDISWDDYHILAGLFCVIGMGMSFVAGASLKALGYPTPSAPSDLTEDQLDYWVDPATVVTEKVQFIFQIFMILAYGTIKASITLYYRRIFVAHRNGVFDIVSKITLAILGLWTITFELIMILACGGNIEANWGPPAAQFQACAILGFSGEYGMAISDLILDLVVILMPLPMVWRLHLPIRRRIAVTGVLLLGCSAIGASIARLTIYVEILHALYAGVFFDPNQQITLALYWSLLEAGLALIAACLPTLAHLGQDSGDVLRKAVRSVASQFSLSSLSSRRSAGHTHDQHSFREDGCYNTTTVGSEGQKAAIDVAGKDAVRVETEVEVTRK